MVSLIDIYDAIDANGFKDSTLQLIDDYKRYRKWKSKFFSI